MAGAAAANVRAPPTFVGSKAMESNDVMRITILNDGTIKTETDGISAPNHQNAERFLRNISTLAGGKTTRTARTDPEAMKHQHSHEHVHENEIHKVGY